MSNAIGFSVRIGDNTARFDFESRVHGEPSHQFLPLMLLLLLSNSFSSFFVEIPNFVYYLPELFEGRKRCFAVEFREFRPPCTL